MSRSGLVPHGNILAKLPKRLQKAALHEVMYAETRVQAREAVQRLATEYGPKYPKARSAPPPCLLLHEERNAAADPGAEASCDLP